MGRTNNEIPCGHFHKNWQRFVKTWFNQPAKKVRRKQQRDREAIRKAPRPIELLRPVVRCPTVRYNSKVRIGKGFTLTELKACKLNSKFAQTIGIAVDFRRRNKSVETLQANVQRLKEYKNKMILFPLGKKKLDHAVTFEHVLKVNQLKKSTVKSHSRIPTKEELNFRAFEYIRVQRTNAKLVGKRLKRKRAAEDAAFQIGEKKKGKKGKSNGDDD